MQVAHGRNIQASKLISNQVLSMFTQKSRGWQLHPKLFKGSGKSRYMNFSFFTCDQQSESGGGEV